MRATGIVRRIDDLGRVVIPKEIRRTMRIREGDPSLITLTPTEKFILGLDEMSKRMGMDQYISPDDRAEPQKFKNGPRTPVVQRFSLIAKDSSCNDHFP